ncbi:MAG: bacteriophage Gp15 family protein [Oscillospiraceae bacterium]|nr:bacteriophage Gp15 family protein [Oscillospiraceae bacterium]
MNLLYEELPAVYEYGGKQYEIRTDFRNWIRFELLFTDWDVPMRDKKNALLRIIFSVVPPDPNLWEFILWFYKCGKEAREVKSAKTKGAKAKATAAVYSFEHDDGYVYSAFLEVYGLDLTAVEYLHWWKFKALFRGLHDCKFTDIMGYRAEDLDEAPDYRKKFLRDMKKLYALPRSLSEQQKIEELKRLKERVGY